MKTVIQELMDIIEMDHNNGVEISQKVIWKMLLKAKEKEKQQIIEAYEKDMSSNGNLSFESGLEYYKETYENK